MGKPSRLEYDGRRSSLVGLDCNTELQYSLLLYKVDLQLHYKAWRCEDDHGCAPFSYLTVRYDQKAWIRSDRSSEQAKRSQKLHNQLGCKARSKGWDRSLLLQQQPASELYDGLSRVQTYCKKHDHRWPAIACWWWAYSLSTHPSKIAQKWISA